MLKVDILKETEKQSKVYEKDPLLKQSEQLLLQSVKEDGLIRNAGLDRLRQIAETKTAKAKARRELEKQSLGAILSEKEVIELCGKYNLRCLRSKMYIGTIPDDLGEDIRKFMTHADDKNIENNVASKLFVLAPPKMFDLKEGEKISFPKVELDPILLYQFVTLEGTFYGVIRKWGKDFTILRRIEGWFSSSAKRISMINTTVHFLLLSTIIAYLGASTILSVSLGAGFALVARWIIFGIWTDNKELRQKFYPNGSWNYQHKRNFITYLGL